MAIGKVASFVMFNKTQRTLGSLRIADKSSLCLACRMERLAELPGVALVKPVEMDVQHLLDRGDEGRTQNQNFEPATSLCHLPGEPRVGLFCRQAGADQRYIREMPAR